MCPLELVATPMPSPIYRLAGSFRKFGADSNGIWGTFRAFARALSCAGVRVSAGVCANWGMAQTSAAHSRQVLVYISLLLFFPPTQWFSRAGWYSFSQTRHDCQA